MDVFKKFVMQFTEDFDFSKIKKINKKYFFIKDNIQKFIDKLDIDDVRAAGLLLGEEKNKKFMTNINLLNLLKDKTDRFVKLNEKASWLFSCGRDVFSENITDRGITFNNVLVLNEKNEIIGMGKFDKKDKKLLKNFYDIGHFLRREKNKR